MNGFSALLDNLPSYQHQQQQQQHGNIITKRIAAEDLEKGDGKWRRTKTGCLSCRRRKVKCDESRPTCERCVKAKLECTWPDMTAVSSPASSSSVSSRAASARFAQLPRTASFAGSSKLRDVGSGTQSWSSAYAGDGGGLFPGGQWASSSRTTISPRSSLLSLPPISRLLHENGTATSVTGSNYETKSAMDTQSAAFDTLFGLPKPAEAVMHPVNFYQDPHFVTRMVESIQGSFAHADDLDVNPVSNALESPTVYDNAKAHPLVAIQPASTPLISPLIQDRPVSISLPRNGTNVKPHKARADVMQTFAPQPAIDPILYGTSQFEIHRMAAARGRIAPSLEQLEKGPPPFLLDNSRVKEWTVPKEIRAAMDGMSHSRHVELLTHYFTNIVGLFNPIDHPGHPFRTLVAKHATESLALLHAVLALSAINLHPHSPEVRAESQLYFEAAVDLFVQSLQQQDDISLFTLLLFSLYSAFEGGTCQPQAYSRQAQNIINERFELGWNYMQALPDLRFLVRLHVWYEVLANVSRMPGDLRAVSRSEGKYSLAMLIRIIKHWDQAEQEQEESTSSYAMSGLLGVPTFVIELLNDISQLSEEKFQLSSSSSQQPVPLDSMRQAAKTYLCKVQALESRIQLGRPGKLVLPPLVQHEYQVHKAVSVRFFDLFRLACSIHLLIELRGFRSDAPAIQARVREMVNLLGNIEQNSNYNTSGIFAFFIAGCAATSQTDRSVLHRRLDSTWNSPPGNVDNLRSVMEETWDRYDAARETGAGITAPGWKEIAAERDWTLLLM